ncbi:two-component system chemotaxis response regulator CheB [Desulfitispora alkaliphila]|uniref:protein-glutamate methylesterase/protein-glutamine glutaminase n=1 Tax=Desulfitispora alkaliphila TaxID=622674 RepID=UPI003D24690C
MVKIKVLVVDDSAFMRQIISDIINKDDELEVIGIARNGQEAIEKLKTLKPDVITLDVEMPVLNGLMTLEIIMREMPTPVIMLSSLTVYGADATVEALEKGAVDFVTKPTGVQIFKVKEELTAKLKVAASTKLRKLRPISKIKPDVEPMMNLQKESTGLKSIVLIGTSTGGPKALQETLPLLPENIPAPILVVQHMPPGFTKSLANRLNKLSAIEVKEAEDGEIIQNGVCYIAPGDYHLVLNEHSETPKIKLTKTKQVSGHRPSVTEMMNSVCANYTGHLIGVILTGMGSDGTDGMTKIKERPNSHTIAEDETTCVVFGMPKSAIKAGCVDTVVPLNKIAREIVNRIRI